MKPILSLFLLFTSAFCLGQLHNYKGTWVSKNTDILRIEDTLGFENNFLMTATHEKKISIDVAYDTLTITSRYYVYKGKRKKLVSEKYVFKQLMLDAQLLRLEPVSVLAQQLIKDNKSFIDFRKIQLKQDVNIKLEKVIFHAGSCFGSCPVIHTQIDKDKNINHYAEVVYKKGTRLKDSVAMGYYKGVMSSFNYKKLELLAQCIDIDNLTYEEVKCCDAPVKTIIIYYNGGKRKYINSMILPPVLQPLSNYLGDVAETSSLKKVNTKLVFEK